jgi:acetyl-CoA C-acetyltransferase
MRAVSVIGIGQVPIKKAHDSSLRVLGAAAIRDALAEAGVTQVDALYSSNMLGDELQGQKHQAALLADEAGLSGVEALHVGAATAGGAAALRVAYLAVASGQVELALAVGVEKMSSSPLTATTTAALAKALDAEAELPTGATLLSQNAHLMALYFDRYHPPADALAYFSTNAHHNAAGNPYALFPDRPITPADVMASRLVSPPLRLLDCAPICDGAAAVLLAPAAIAHRYTTQPVHILASTVATDRFRLADRPDPLSLAAAHHSAAKAYQQANITPNDVSFFELHDAFSIMACLQLEAAGFAPAGQGWRLAVEGEIALNGRIPIATLGGLKARGHPIGATALYQLCEIVQQLTGRAGPNQLPNPRLALTQSVGGAAGTVITHLLGIETRERG